LSANGKFETPQTGRAQADSLPFATLAGLTGDLAQYNADGSPFAKSQQQFVTRRCKAMAKTSFTPLHDRILVRRIEEGESKVGGIIIPDSAKEKPQQGEVISVGKGKSNDEGKVFPLDVKAGDNILFGKYSGTEIKIDGEELLIMREEEVLGILKK
jgi:chaperonin GroES